MSRLKVAVALSLMGSGLVFAGTMGPVCTPGNVTVPCASSAWGVSASALYLQPTYSGALGYLGENDPNFSTNFVKNNPDWNWGFQIGASYYSNTGSDVSLNWYHLTNTSTTKDAFYTFGVPLAQRSYEGNIASVSPSWDAANFEVGQLVNLSSLSTVRLYAGVQYSRIATSLTHLDTLLELVSGDYDTEEMQYSGFGPRLGVDLAYFVTSDFSVYAKPAIAVLVGSNKTNSIRGNLNDPISRVSYVNRTQVVPEADLKLGLQYDYALPSGKLSIDSGYMWVNYFSPISQVNQFVNNLDTGNFGLDGVYFGLKWVGSV